MALNVTAVAGTLLFAAALSTTRSIPAAQPDKSGAITEAQYEKLSQTTRRARMPSSVYRFDGIVYIGNDWRKIGFWLPAISPRAALASGLLLMYQQRLVYMAQAHERHWSYRNSDL